MEGSEVPGPGPGGPAQPAQPANVKHKTSSMKTFKIYKNIHRAVYRSVLKNSSNMYEVRIYPLHVKIWTFHTAGLEV